MHKKMLEEIKHRKSDKDLREVSDLLAMALDKAKEEHPEFYEYIESRLYELIYGKVLNCEMAEKIISKMKPYGMHWTKADVEHVLDAHSIHLSLVDAWVVMNMAYNDFHKLFGDDVEMYLKYTREFIEDEDAKPGKVYTYFTQIPQ